MKESKYVTIYKEWKEKIESGQIAEGERLPTESSLMESYQVSRDTVRKSRIFWSRTDIFREEEDGRRW